MFYAFAEMFAQWGEIVQKMGGVVHGWPAIDLLFSFPKYSFVMHESPHCQLSDHESEYVFAYTQGKIVNKPVTSFLSTRKREMM